MPTHADTVRKAYRWLADNFETSIQAAFRNTPFLPKHLYGIAWVESSELWPNLIGRYDTGKILSFCVLDGSGDVSGTTRSAFPRNAAAFRRVYGALTDTLIAEGQKARKVRGLPPANILYKGYGIFQYDLQFIRADGARPADLAFFRDKQWYDFDQCLARVKKELLEAYGRTHDIRAAIKAYNGSGAAATNYVNEVFHFIHDLETLGLVAPNGD